MKRSGFNPLISGLLAASLLVIGPAGYVLAKPLTPGPDNASITAVVVRQLVRQQYLHEQFDAKVASRFLDRYLDTLDPQHLLFFQSDLKEFEPLRAKLQEATWNDGDTSTAYVVFDRLLQRAQEQRDFVVAELKGEAPTFDKNETYTVDRRKAARPVDASDAQKLWRERLRYEYLQEKLADQKPEEIVKTLTRRYENGLTMLKQYDSDELLELYLTTLARVFDPHSDYLGHGSLEEFRIQMKLSLFGIGAVLQSDDGYCKIVDVPAGGPAARSGQLKPGDRIVAVAQKNAEPVDVVGMKLNKIVDMIRGPRGTEVRLTLIPADASDPAARKVITLVRDEVKLEEQEAKSRVLDLPGANGKNLRLGVVDLPGFYAGGGGPGERAKSATEDVARLLKKLNQVGVQGLILDLRGNGGGSLDEAIRLTGLFIKDGPVVQEKDPDGSVHIDRDPDPGIAYSGPMVVLVNRGTASASEILAGALQDYGRAVIVGDSSSFGKGTVQSVMALGPLFQRAQIKTQNDPGALKVTIQKFYRPSGASTQLKGVVPDIVLPSLTDAMEVGEKVMDDPLPWDTVKSATFTKMDVVGKHLAELRKRSAARVAADRDFNHVREEVEQYRKTIDTKQVSLNEAERRKAREEAEARQKAWKAELAKRPASKEKVITVTLKQVDAPGLPAADKVASVTTSRSRFTAANGEGPDTVMDEGKRILADLISLAAAK